MAIANGTCGKCYMDWKEDSMLVKRIQHIPIYLQPFTSYSEILLGNCNFSYPLAFNAPVRVFPLESLGKVWSSENYTMLQKRCHLTHVVISVKS